MLPTGTRPGTALVSRGGAAALVGAGPFALAVASLPFGREQAGFGSVEEAIPELGVEAWDCGVAALGVFTTAAREAVRARLAASR